MTRETDMEYYTVGVVLRTLQCRFFGTTDVTRWRDAETFADWEERTRLIAQLVPKKARVIEFGAGKRKLESLVDPSCTYIPCDIVSRGANTLVFDLNARPLPNLRYLKLDVAVCAGVFEYIADLNLFVTWLSQQVTTCIASYECAQTRSWRLARLRETIRRTAVGWVNTFNEEELIEMFRSGGFTLTETKDWHTPDGSERIFVFRNLSQLKHRCFSLNSTLSLYLRSMAQG
jgi:hypothetical protein